MSFVECVSVCVCARGACASSNILNKGLRGFRPAASEHIRRKQHALLECKASAWYAQVTDVFDASLNPRRAVRVHLRKRPPGTNFVPSSTPSWDPDYIGSARFPLCLSRV